MSGERWYSIPAGGVLYGDGTGGATVIGVVDHWPHDDRRRAALAALEEAVRERDRLRAELDRARPVIDAANVIVRDRVEHPDLAPTLAALDALDAAVRAYQDQEPGM